jgi:hypothetical protein
MQVDGVANIALNAVPNVVPNVAPNVVPNITADVAPNVTPNVVPNITADVAPNVTPNVVPNIAADIAPNVAPNVAADIAPNVVPNVIPNVAPTVIPNMAPNVVPNAAPNAVLNPLNLHPAAWPAETELIFVSGTTRVMLTMQQPLMRSVICDTFERVRVHLLFNNAFPDASIVRSMTRTSLVEAAESRGQASSIHQRLLHDEAYVMHMIRLVCNYTFMRSN